MLSPSIPIWNIETDPKEFSFLDLDPSHLSSLDPEAKHFSSLNLDPKHFSSLDPDPKHFSQKIPSKKFKTWITIIYLFFHSYDNYFWEDYLLNPNR